MNRYEFMDKLAELLSDVNDDEREEALKYYNDYFEDAGSWNEENVLQELVSPEKVAATIKESLVKEYVDEGYSYKDFIDDEEEEKEEKVREVVRTETIVKSKGFSGTTVALIIIACIILSPVIAAAVGSFFSLITTVITLIIVLTLIIAISPFAISAASIVTIVAGAIEYSADSVFGMLVLGSGIIGFGIGLICFFVFWAYFFKLVPAVFRGIAGKKAKKGGNA